jgi:hypothetical protein
VEAEDLPLVAVLDQFDPDPCFAFLKLGCRLVVRGRFSRLSEDGGDVRLAFGGVAMLETSELAEAVEEAVALGGADYFRQLGAGPGEEGVYVPVCDDVSDGGVGISAAFPVESRAADGDENESDYC